MEINIPESSLVVLVGAMGTGKSTFCEKHFDPHNVVSSDFIRLQTCGNFEDQSQNQVVFDILFSTINARAKAGIFTVVDTTGPYQVVNVVRAIGTRNRRPLIMIQFPELKNHELVPERMQHRMKYLDAYHNQVERIRNMRADGYKLYKLDDVDNLKIVAN